MSPALLLANRTNRVGDLDLGILRLTADALAHEAGMGRGVLITDCCAGALSRHVAQAVRNAAAPVTVAPATYAMGEEITDNLEGLAVSSWRGRRGTDCGTGDSDADIQITVPEQLHIVERRVRAGLYAPGMVFVVDAEGYLDRSTPRWSWHSHRGENVGRFRAACQAAGCRSPVVVWTTQPAMSFTFATLCRVYGVDAWLCLDGRTLRTACTGPAMLVDCANALQAATDSEQQNKAFVAAATEPLWERCAS